MSNRTSGKLHAHHKTFLRMTFLFISTRHLRAIRRIVANRDNPFGIARSPNRNVAAASDNPADCASGGAGRDRTDDILLAKQALSQLSYGPLLPLESYLVEEMVGLGGLEPPTSRLSSARSNQLSYKP